MKYSDLISPTYIISSNSLLNKDYAIKKLPHDNSYFIHFSPQQSRFIHRKISTNWKARLSIHPDDMDKAWELIIPLFTQNSLPFKVANHHTFEKFNRNRQEKLEQTITKYHEFLENKNFFNINYLKHIFHDVYQTLHSYSYSRWHVLSFIQTYFTKLGSYVGQYVLSRDQLVTYTKNIYDTLIDLEKQKVDNSMRFCEGMQFTIYILPGLERNYQNILEEIEHKLIEKRIRPGIIFPTDRPIGIYSSIRHPGKWYYYSATNPTLETYNPDDVDDPFNFLDTLSSEKIMQDCDIQAILRQKNHYHFIVHALKTKKLITPSQLKVLAIYKSHLLEHIKTLPLDIKKKIVIESLDKSSNLGKFFRVKRSIFSPKLGHGTLKQLADIRLTTN